MLTAKTVFVLGAGASDPYGFPTGAALTRELLGSLNKRSRSPRTPPFSTYELLTDAGFDDDHIQAFRTSLRDSGRLSVDAFLEHRREFLKVGKAAIACALLPRENHECFFGLDEAKDNHWYTYLFNKLSADFDNLEGNDVAFLTFNYDRSLEYYLVTAIQHSYAKSFDEARRKVDRLRIVHLYGSLGPLTEEDAGLWRRGKIITGETARAAADGIRIMYAPSDTAEQFAQAKQLLSEASVVCFLGFGYHPTNIERLLEAVSQRPHGHALGTAFGLGRAERASVENQIKQRLPVFHLGEPHNGTLEFLRHYFHWW